MDLSRPSYSSSSMATPTFLPISLFGSTLTLRCPTRMPTASNSALTFQNWFSTSLQ